jgi:hypothetical protein
MIILPTSFVGRCTAESFSVDATGLTLTTEIILFHSTETNYLTRFRKISIDASGIDVQAGGAFGAFNYTHYLSDINLFADGINVADARYFRPFNLCNFSKNIRVTLQNLDTIGTNAHVYGMSQCHRSSGCYVTINLVNDAGNDYDVMNFYSCWYLTSCWALKDKTGPTTYDKNICYEMCDFASGCYAIKSGANGFFQCNFLSSCSAEDNELNGFMDCDQLTSCESFSNDSDGFEECEFVSCCHAHNNVGYGFLQGKQMQQNKSTSNTAGQYSLSYADQTSNACANTAAGGYNY